MTYPLKNLTGRDPLWDEGLPGDEEFYHLDPACLDLEELSDDTVIPTGPTHDDYRYDLVDIFNPNKS